MGDGDMGGDGVMVRALDIAGGPVVEVTEPEPEPEPEFYTSNVIDTVNTFLQGAGTPTNVSECLRYLGHRIDDLRAENHRLRQRLAPDAHPHQTESMSEYMHQNPDYGSFSATRAGERHSSPADRLLLRMAQRLDKIVGREFAPGRTVTKVMCRMCGEPAREGCGVCTSQQRPAVWRDAEVPLNAKTGD